MKRKKSHFGKQSLTECALRHSPCQSEFAEFQQAAYLGGTSHLDPSKSAYHKRKMTAIKAVIHRLSGKRDSDPRPQPWQGCALPTELFPQYNPVPRGWDYKGTEFFLICKLFLNFFVRVCSRVAEYGFAVFAVYHNLAVLAYFTFKDFLCKLVDQFSLNQSFDRTGTIFRIVAVLYHVVFKRFRE